MQTALRLKFTLYFHLVYVCVSGMKSLKGHPVCCFQEKLAYHRRSRKLLSPGLYLGYLKLCTSVEQIRALVPQKLPNVLCHTKIRDNSNVSRLGSRIT